jgi:glyoxylate utilization-related uncharacterized protein
MKPYLQTLARKRNEKPGYLVPIEDADLGFPIRRVFFISGMEQGGMRGYHGHRETTTQCLVCVQGSVTVDVGGETFTLTDDTTALVVPPDNYIVMTLSPTSILLVLCSTSHKEDVLFQQ